MSLLLAAALASLVSCGPFQAADGRGAGRPVVRCQAERAVVDFDPQGLSDRQREAFTSLADRGVRDLERLLASRLPGSGWPERVRFVVGARVTISRTFGRTVLLPLGRVRDGRAPYLHETVHALLPAAHRSAWLSEGIACYLESWVAANLGGYDAHVFTRAGDREIHAAARRHARTDAGRAVLPWVGAPGQPPRLSEDRAAVARPFYVLAHSFTKYLVDELGLDAVLKIALAEDPERALLLQSGRCSAEWRAVWLQEAG
jgi:hypothetical protein